MKIAIKILPRTKPLRLLFCFGGGMLLAFILSIFSHYRYWYGTIKSLQTTQLNILSETLPSQLSLLLINQEKQKIQKLLNSTDGYIGLVVTNCQTIKPDCSSEKVIYQTSFDKDWHQNWQANNLKTYPFDILTRPKINSDSPVNNQQILGRVYYISLSPPTIVEALKQWLINLLKLKKQGLLHPNTGFFLFTFLSSLIVRRFIETEVNRIKSIAKSRHRQLESEIHELHQYNQSLIDEKQKINNDFSELNKQIIELKQKTNKFKKEVKEKEKKLHQQEQKISKNQDILTYYEKELGRIKKIKLIGKEEKEDLGLKIKQQQELLKEQEVELNNYLQELQTTNQELTLNQYKEEEIIRLLRQREKEKSQLEKTLKQKEQAIKQLEQQKENFQSWQEIAQQLEEDLQDIELLQEKINALEQEKNTLKKVNDKLQISNKQLKISLLELQKQNGQNDPSIGNKNVDKNWELLCTEKFIDFWYDLSEEDKIKTSIYLDYLQQKGVTLKYPYSSNIKGSSYRELIPISHADEAIRIFYRFTPSRMPILLCGGDKDGCNSEKWYKKYVSIAEDEYHKYLQNQEAFSFNELWSEMNIIARQEAVTKFMKI